MRALHVHIGPGSLGLGLVVRSANEAKLDSHLVGRKGSPAAIGQFTLALTDQEPLALETASYSEAERFDELCPQAQEAIASDLPLLITTAVGSDLTACADLIGEIASRRAKGGGTDTVFIACENHLGASHSTLIAELEALGVECRPTMVNRLCPERRLDPETASLVVRADPHAEWLIQGQADGGALTEIERADAVAFVPDVEPYAGRKLWLVNGGHLALALFARAKKEPSVRAVAQDSERQEQLVELQADMMQAFPEGWRRVLDDSIAFARRQLIPFCRTEDSTRRILKRLRRTNLGPFLEDANRKLGEPARLYAARSGRISFSFEDVLDTLQDVLLNFDMYEDAIEIREGEAQLDRSADEQAIKAYDALLDGVFPPQVRAARVARLRRRFERHRMLLA